MSKKAWFSILLCHLFLFDVTLSSNGAGENSETKAPETTGAPTTKATNNDASLPVTTTTQLPTTDVIQDGKHETLEIHLGKLESVEKPVPKKRGILDALFQPEKFFETVYDTNDDAGPDESFPASRSDFEEKPFYKYGDAAFVTDDGYFENEGRTKRTADVDELYYKPQAHEIELSPEDIVALVGLLEGRTYKEDRPKYWPYDDNVVGSIEADMRDEDVYRDRNGYENGFESYPSDVRRYPTGRRRRNSIYEHQRLNTPTYKRLIL